MRQFPETLTDHIPFFFGSTDPAAKLNRNSDFSNYFESSRKRADLRLPALSSLAFSFEPSAFLSVCVCVGLWLINLCGESFLSAFSPPEKRRIFDFQL
jgi:hypothetical protein